MTELANSSTSNEPSIVPKSEFDEGTGKQGNVGVVEQLVTRLTNCRWAVRRQLDGKITALLSLLEQHGTWWNKEGNISIPRI